MGLRVYRACSDAFVPFFRIIKVYGYTAMFFFFVSKGDNFCKFLFAAPGQKNSFKRGLLLKERICSYRSKFFSLRVDPQGDKGQK